MEYIKTNHSSSDKWNTANYKVGSIYKNTDELNMVDFILIDESTVLWSYPENVMNILKDFFNQKEEKESDSIIDSCGIHLNETNTLEMLRIITNK